MSSFARPKPNEGEEDLLRLQEEFLKKSTSPSASVINKRKTDNKQRNVSKFAKTSHKTEKTAQSAVTSVLGDIKERIPEFMNWSFNLPSNNMGFPEVFESGENLHGKNASIFSQHINSCQQSENIASNVTVIGGNCSNLIQTIGSKSYILSGNDSQEIHQENVKKLSEMSVEEIQSEQTKLKEMMDPKLLQFLLSRRERKSNPVNLDMDVEQLPCDQSENQKGMPCNEDKDFEKGNSEHSSLPIHSESTNSWLHMNVVEEEKLKWVGDIPPTKTIVSGQQYNARFNFQGLLMPFVAEEVDVRQALYHHGQEPQRPGYSIEELYQLSRSSVLQQRVVALNTIGNILEKVKKGYYDICFSENLLPQLLDHELFLLLRFALDENTEIQLVATLFALKNLLCSDVDELCLDRAMGCQRSVLQPNLYVVLDIPQNKEQELKDTETELKDFEMLKVDLVKGALRTDITIRIRYILEVLKPGPKAVISCLEILTRLARHSYDAALAITCCPRLLQMIITNFVPKDWSPMVGDVKPTDMESVYGIPLVEALKLLRIIACYSRKLASDLVHKYSIMDSIISYISVDPRECSLPFREVLKLSLESFYIWQTFLTYNMATQHFIDLYPVLMRLLQFHFHATSVENDSSPFSHEHGAALISLIEQAILVAHFQNLHKQHSSRTLSYYHIKDFSNLLDMCLTKWLAQLRNGTVLMFSAMKLVGETFNCLASLYKFHVSQVDFDVVNWLSNLEQICETRILQYLKSEGWQMATANMQASSCLLFTGELGSKRDPPSLPSLGALMWKGECVSPVLHPKSPVALLNGLLNFLATAYSLHKGLNSKYLEILLEDSAFVNYIKNINKEASAKLASHWFTRLEVSLLASFLKLAYIKNLHLEMVHQLAFKIVTLIQRDEKYRVSFIMKHIIFNADFFKNSSAICDKMAALQIESSSNTISRENLILKSCHELPGLWDCYKKCLNLDEDTLIDNYAEIINLTASKHGTDLLLPVDWSYLPIVHLHNQDKSEQKVNEESAALVIAALKWVFLVEELRPDVAVVMNVTNRFCRLSTVFLCGSDFFLDSMIHGLLDACLRRLLQEYQRIKFPSSFYDLYTQLLEQFAAVSYGDSLFGQFLLVPLQQRHSPDLRKQVWSEHAAVLRILSTPLDQLMFPINEMLEPCETDRSLLLTYLQCLATGIVRKNWSPVLHLVAVHHVATFITLHNNTELAQQLKSRISKLGNKELQTLLMNYQHAV